MPINHGIYYSLHEEGSRDSLPAVLIHGAGGDHLYWPASIRRLAGQTVLGIDLPGHGKSSGNSQQSLWSYAGWLADFLTQIGYYQVVLVGHSMGGCLALAMALEYPGQVAGLGLISTAPHIDFSGDLLNLAAHPASFPLVVEALTHLAFSPSTDLNLVQDASRRLSETRPSLLYSDLMACAVFDAHARLNAIKVPTLVMTGMDDQITPPGSARALAVSLPNASVYIIPAAGHMAPLEQPDEVAGRLGQFLVQFSI
jgi:pimeloyl-ACP methyl ester carboxylesterase